MSREMASMHVTYTDASGAPRSESFDPEEFKDRDLNIDEVVRDLIEDGASVIILTIDTE